MFRPIADRIIVEPKVEARSAGGIILAPSQEKPVIGTVVAVGTGRVTEAGNVIPMTLKSGDVVMFTKYSGMGYKESGKDFLVMREEEVLAVSDK